MSEIIQDNKSVQLVVSLLLNSHNNYYFPVLSAVACESGVRQL